MCNDIPDTEPQRVQTQDHWHHAQTRQWVGLLGCYRGAAVVPPTRAPGAHSRYQMPVAPSFSPRLKP